MAVHGPTTGLVGWSDPLFAPALGAIFSGIGGGAAAAPGTPLGNLLALLQALGIATVPAGPATPISIDANAINALTVDPLGFLTPKLRTALANGAIPGFTASAAGGFTAPIGALPLEAIIGLSPPSVGLRTTGAGLALGASVAAGFSVDVPLTGLATGGVGATTAGPVTLAYANAGAIGACRFDQHLPIVAAHAYADRHRDSRDRSTSAAADFRHRLDADRRILLPPGYKSWACDSFLTRQGSG